MFHRALVGTDLGPSSEGIVACAGALRPLGITEAVLAHAIDLDHEPTAADDAAFSAQVDALESAGINVHVETPLGYPAHALTSLALQHGADLIVLGSRGQGLFHTGFSGSISSDVVRLSHVPVLLAPASMVRDAEEGTEACGRLLSSVLMATDLSESAELLCRLVCGLAQSHIGRLEILNVVELSFEAVREGRESQGREALEQFAERARDAGILSVHTSIARGMPDEVVTEFSASRRYSLIVLAPHCSDTIDKAFDSVTSAVLRDSSTPMLLATPRCDPQRYWRGNT